MSFFDRLIPDSEKSSREKEDTGGSRIEQIRARRSAHGGTNRPASRNSHSSRSKSQKYESTFADVGAYARTPADLALARAKREQEQAQERKRAQQQVKERAQQRARATRFRGQSATWAGERPGGWLSRIPLPRIAIGRIALPNGIRWVELGLAGICMAMLIFIFASDYFYVQSINTIGVRYVDLDRVYAVSGLHGSHILWVNPAQATEKLLQAEPNIKHADIKIVWPAKILVTIEEYEPTILWQQGGAENWITSDGKVVAALTSRPDLLPIIADAPAEPLTVGGSVPPAAVEGAILLKALRTNIESLHYDPINGLSYQDGRGWRGYFGTGANMEHKLLVYETLVADLETRGIHPQYILVVDPESPVYYTDQMLNLEGQ
jgi:hypothetical protein